MTDPLKEAIIDHANVANKDKFPGQKLLLRLQALRLAEMVDEPLPANIHCLCGRHKDPEAIMCEDCMAEIERREEIYRYHPDTYESEDWLDNVAEELFGG